jgi:hypothetical protein
MVFEAGRCMGGNPALRQELPKETAGLYCNAAPALQTKSALGIAPMPPRFRLNKDLEQGRNSS